MNVSERLSLERGLAAGVGRRQVAVIYPAPYHLGMASLGFQTVFRTLNELPDTVAERAFAPESDEGLLSTYESQRPVADFDVVAFSIAWELELADLIRCLEAAGLPIRAKERSSRAPWVIAGGPLASVNPRLLDPFVDAVVVGDGEPVLAPLLDELFSGARREVVLEALSQLPGVFVPSVHGDQVPPPARADLAALPARAAIWTRESALPDMFLVEAERGCSRGCTFCVMGRHAGGGMRVIPSDAVLRAIPSAAPRVGLVGAAVSDHPELDVLLAGLVAAGKGIGISSLRADRLTDERVGLLARGGYRTLTVAVDGPSQRQRHALDKGIKVAHIERAVELAARHGIRGVKLYAMIGLPDETEADLDELMALVAGLTLGGRTRLTLAVSPFVPKPHTPLAEAPFLGVRALERRLQRLGRLRPQVRVPAASARWAWVEWVLAHGGPEAGEAVAQAVQEGGGFAAWKRALGPLEPGGKDGTLPR